MLDCQAKYAQTSYQFMNVMDPAGRRSLVASGGPLNVPRHIRNCVEPAFAWQIGLFERAEACAQCNRSDISQSRDDGRMSRSLWENIRKMTVI